MLIYMAIMFLGLIIGVTGGMFEARWVTYVGVVLAIGAMFRIAASGVIEQNRSRIPRRREPAQQLLSPEPVTRVDTTNKLLPIGETEFVPSVTEHTTELLKQKR